MLAMLIDLRVSQVVTILSSEQAVKCILSSSPFYRGFNWGRWVSWSKVTHWKGVQQNANAGSLSSELRLHYNV